MLTGLPCNLDVGLSDKIESVKQKINVRRGIVSNQWCLIYNGKKLDDSRTLFEYNI